MKSMIWFCWTWWNFGHFLLPGRRLFTASRGTWLYKRFNSDFAAQTIMVRVYLLYFIIWHHFIWRQIYLSMISRSLKRTHFKMLLIRLFGDFHTSKTINRDNCMHQHIFRFINNIDKRKIISFESVQREIWMLKVKFHV